MAFNYGGGIHDEPKKTQDALSNSVRTTTAARERERRKESEIQLAVKAAVRAVVGDCTAQTRRTPAEEKEGERANYHHSLHMRPCADRSVAPLVSASPTDCCPETENPFHHSSPPVLQRRTVAAAGAKGTK